MRLTDAQLIDITGKVRPSAQARVLQAMGIPFRRRPDGKVVILTSDLHEQTAQTRQASPSLRF